MPTNPDLDLFQRLQKEQRVFRCFDGPRTVSLERAYWDHLAEIAGRTGHASTDDLVRAIARRTGRSGFAGALRAHAVQFYRNAATAPEPRA